LYVPSFQALLPSTFLLIHQELAQYFALLASCCGFAQQWLQMKRNMFNLKEREINSLFFSINPSFLLKLVVAPNKASLVDTILTRQRYLLTHNAIVILKSKALLINLGYQEVFF
jgi:hypothetical protein